MAYTPNTWNDGDVITKDKMNTLEMGVKMYARSLYSLPQILPAKSLVGH